MGDQCATKAACGPSEAPRHGDSGPQARAALPLRSRTHEALGLHGHRHIPCRMALSLWSSRRYFSSDVSATVPIRALSEDTPGPGPSEVSEPESKGSPSGGWVFRGPGFFTGELQREAHQGHGQWHCPLPSAGAIPCSSKADQPRAPLKQVKGDMGDTWRQMLPQTGGRERRTPLPSRHAALRR